MFACLAEGEVCPSSRPTVHGRGKLPVHMAAPDDGTSREGDERRAERDLELPRQRKMIQCFVLRHLKGASVFILIFLVNLSSIKLPK